MENWIFWYCDVPLILVIIVGILSVLFVWNEALKSQIRTQALRNGCVVVKTVKGEKLYLQSPRENMWVSEKSFAFHFKNDLYRAGCYRDYYEAELEAL